MNDEILSVTIFLGLLVFLLPLHSTLYDCKVTHIAELYPKLPPFEWEESILGDISGNLLLKKVSKPSTPPESRF